MSFFPETIVGWVTCLASSVAITCTTYRVYSYLAQFNATEQAIQQREPEILDPLEEEFRQLEQSVEQRALIEGQLQQVAKRRAESQYLLSQGVPCKHSRLRMITDRADFVCLDCGQLVQTRARKISS